MNVAAHVVAQKANVHPDHQRLTEMLPLTNPNEVSSGEKRLFNQSLTHFGWRVRGQSVSLMCTGLPSRVGGKGGISISMLKADFSDTQNLLQQAVRCCMSDVCLQQGKLKSLDKMSKNRKLES